MGRPARQWHNRNNVKIREVCPCNKGLAQKKLTASSKARFTGPSLRGEEKASKKRGPPCTIVVGQGRKRRAASRRCNRGQHEKKTYGRSGGGESEREHWLRSLSVKSYLDGSVLHHNRNLTTCGSPSHGEKKGRVKHRENEK